MKKIEAEKKKKGKRKKMETKILLWNARGWRNKKEEITKRIQDYDVCVITETKNKINEGFKIPAFITIIKDSQRIGGSGRNSGRNSDNG